MKTQKRSKHKISTDEMNAEKFMNKIPSALLELQKRGFLLPQKEKLELDELHVLPPTITDEETGQEAPFNHQVLNVFERHEQRLANALTGVYQTTANNFANELNQKFEKNVEGNTLEMNSSSLTNIHSDSISSGLHTSNNWQSSFGIKEPQSILSQLSGNLDGIKGANTLNFQLPEIPTSSKSETKIEIGKLIEQVNIHSQDISGGSQQLVKVLKEKLVEILQDELNTKY